MHTRYTHSAHIVHTCTYTCPRKHTYTCTHSTSHLFLCCPLWCTPPSAWRPADAGVCHLPLLVPEPAQAQPLSRVALRSCHLGRVRPAGGRKPVYHPGSVVLLMDAVRLRTGADASSVGVLVHD